MAPGVADGVVYVAAADHLYALGAATGAERWRYQGLAHPMASPVIAGGVAYFPATDRRLHALDLATREELWEFETGGYTRSRPALVDGVLYFGSDDGFVYAVVASLASEGTVPWHRRIV